MKSFCVVVDLQASFNQPDLGKQMATDAGFECHVLGNAWCIRTNKALDELYSDLTKLPALSNAAFMVVPIDGTWRSHHCKTEFECFD